jgi:CRP-like cAMP-binding protein
LPYFKEVEFSPKQVIWNESEQSEFSLVIRSGRVLMSKYNKLANFMVVTQRYLKFCIQGELNFIGEKELISQSVREFTCEAMEELVKAYLITGEVGQILSNDRIYTIS